jgi:hypothetical protein
MPTPTVTTDLIRESDLAAELDRDVRTLQRWRARRIGPAYIRIGRQIFYRAEAVREWLVSLEQQQPRAGRTA